MAYLVLARKYRPRTFAEVCGQEVATRMLQGAIEDDRVGHAYLFAGPRGTGKTTTARIFAKALNCEQGPAPEPCGTCERCTQTDRGAEVDIVEIDAASNTGVDDVRALRDQVAFTPMRARTKVYIVDEVHMLSTQAFNALLKTLEEPPPHVKFFFATTELHKVPETILSRCQVVRLGLIAEDTIAAGLGRVLEAEGVTVEDGVLTELARRARGSMRDGLSLTDQLLALAGTAPTVDDVRRLGGPTSPERIDELLDALEAHDRPAVAAILSEVDGGENELGSALLETLRQALFTVLCPDKAALVVPTEDERQRLAARAKRLGAERIETWLEELLRARERAQRMPQHGRVLLEVTLFDLARPETGWSAAELVERLASLEARLGGAPAPSASPRPGSGPEPAPPPKPAAAPPAPSEASPRTSAEAPPAHELRPRPRSRPAAIERSAGEAWKAFLESLGARLPSLAQVLEKKGELIDWRAEAARIRLARPTEPERQLVDDAANRKACQRVFEELTGRSIAVTLEVAAPRDTGQTDAFTRQVADLFGGEIEDSR